MSRRLLHIRRGRKRWPQSAEIETQLTTLASEPSRVTKLMFLTGGEHFRNPPQTEPPAVAGGPEMAEYASSGKAMQLAHDKRRSRGARLPATG
jgi:hypothetical protein